ncbi:hypothetical protein [Candidatus Poriferisodalis sp.]|uniref:hypothetical protein n=1 Tax=Candidatus Poriferisodalis sp. TaxID=3101277 RepID=UPI003B0112E0
MSPASASTVHLWQPRTEDRLPIPWVEFEEGYERVAEAGISVEDILHWAIGTLWIEGNCLYLRLPSNEVPENQMPTNWNTSPVRVLSLPKDLIQYDRLKGKLWFHLREGAEGPFRSGDEVIVFAASERDVRSSACGDNFVMSGSWIETCGHRDNLYHLACATEAYVSTHGVQWSEARRRLQRIPEMLSVVSELRSLESVRIAGWGIDNASSYARDGDAFVAWLLLTDDQPPSRQAEMLAGLHGDIEIRNGATTSYTALKSAQEQFDDGRGIHLPLDSSSVSASVFELSEAVAWTWIDHRANRLTIGLDRHRVPDVGDWQQHVDARNGKGGAEHADRHGLADNRLYVAIAAELDALIDVPFTVVYAEKVNRHFNYVAGNWGG